MWTNALPINTIVAKSSAQLCEIIDSVIDDASLAEAIDSGSWWDRKEVCQFLGVAPSTLSGWEKDNRIPRSAKLAMGLFVAVEKLRAFINDSDDSWTEAKVVRDGARWLIVRHARDVDGLWTGEVLGEAKSEELAWRFAGSDRSLKLLSQADSVVGEFEEAYGSRYSESDPFMKDVRELRGKLDRHRAISEDVSDFRIKKRIGREVLSKLREEHNSSNNAGRQGAASINEVDS